jgi:hypothetical protein
MAGVLGVINLVAFISRFNSMNKQRFSWVNFDNLGKWDTKTEEKNWGIIGLKDWFMSLLGGVRGRIRVGWWLAVGVIVSETAGVLG